MTSFNIVRIHLYNEEHVKNTAGQYNIIIQIYE